MLAFAPEPISALVARYREAVVETIDLARVAMGLRPGPSGERRHVLDCRDGMRLFVSRVRLPKGVCGIYISASVWPDSIISMAIMRREMTPPEFVQFVVGRWQTLAGTAQQPEVIGWSETGVPHLWLEERQ